MAEPSEHAASADSIEPRSEAITGVDVLGKTQENLAELEKSFQSLRLEDLQSPSDIDAAARQIRAGFRMQREILRDLRDWRETLVDEYASNLQRTRELDAQRTSNQRLLTKAKQRDIAPTLEAFRDDLTQRFRERDVQEEGKTADERKYLHENLSTFQKSLEQTLQTHWSEEAKKITDGVSTLQDTTRTFNERRTEEHNEIVNKRQEVQDALAEFQKDLTQKMLNLKVEEKDRQTEAWKQSRDDLDLLRKQAQDDINSLREDLPRALQRLQIEDEAKRTDKGQQQMHEALSTIKGDIEKAVERLHSVRTDDTTDVRSDVEAALKGFMDEIHEKLLALDAGREDQSADLRNEIEQGFESVTESISNKLQSTQITRLQADLDDVRDREKELLAENARLRTSLGNLSSSPMNGRSEGVSSSSSGRASVRIAGANRYRTSETRENARPQLGSTRSESNLRIPEKRHVSPESQEIGPIQKRAQAGRQLTSHTSQMQPRNDHETPGGSNARATGAAVARTPSSGKSTRVSERTPSRSNSVSKEPPNMRSIDDVVGTLLAYDPDEGTKFPASELSNDVKAALEACLDKFRYESNFKLLKSNVQRSSAAVCAHKRLDHKGKQEIIGLQACSPCRENKRACIAAEHTGLPTLVPLPPDDRNGATIEDPEFWISSR